MQPILFEIADCDDHIGKLKELLKAGGKKDISKLRKEVITNKRGKRQTVYKKIHEDEKKNVFDIIMEFFGFKKKNEVLQQLDSDYKKHDIATKFNLSHDQWTSHYLEYFKHKKRWDAAFAKKKTTEGGGERKKGGEKKTGGGDEKKKGITWNRDVMKFLHELYGKGKPETEKEVGKYKDLVGKKFKISTTMVSGSSMKPEKIDSEIVVEKIDDSGIHYRDAKDVGKPAHEGGSGFMTFNGFNRMVAAGEMMEIKPDVTEKVKELLTTKKERKRKPLSSGEGEKEESKPRGPTEEKKKYLDVGEKIGGARKDIAALMNMYKTEKDKAVSMTDLEAIEESGEAGLLINRERQFGGKKAIVDMMRSVGADSGATYIVWRLASSIEKMPADNPESRKKYVLGIERLLKTVVNWTDVSAAREGLSIIQSELNGYYYTDSELATSKAIDERTSKIKSEINKIWNQIYIPKYKGTGGDWRRKASDIFWKDPDVVKLEKQKDELRKEFLKIRKVAQERSDNDPMSPANLYKALGKSFTELIAPPWRSKRRDTLINNAYKNDDWKWAGGAKETGEEEKERKKKSRERLKWRREVPEEVERVSQAGTKDYESKTLMNDFGLRAVEYGNWMDIESSKIHTQRAGEALADLAYLFGVDKKLISLNGRLAIAFGARGKGKASAHYEPGRKVINITKERGGGSLAHEWGHALDNILSIVAYKEAGQEGGNISFMSDSDYKNKYSHTLGTVQTALDKVNDAIHKGSFVMRKTINLKGSERYQHSTFWKYEERTAIGLYGEPNEKGRLQEIWKEVKTTNDKYKGDNEAHKKPEFYDDLFAHKDLQHPVDRARMREFIEGDILYRSDFAMKHVWELVPGEGIIDWKTVDVGKLGEYLQKKADEYVDTRKSQYDDDYFKRKYLEKDWDRLDKRVAYEFRKESDADYIMSKLYHDGDKKEPITINMKSVRPVGGKSNYFSTASKMGGYWKRPHELFARAFESYVYDKLREKNMKNSYLVSGVSKEAAANWGKKAKELEGEGGVTSIYPLGDERERINAAMDELVEAIKEHEVLAKAIQILDAQLLKAPIEIFGIKV